MLNPSANLTWAIETVRLACAVTQAVQADLRPDAAVSKDDLSPVTAADFAVQALVAARLKLHASGVPLMAEEEPGALDGPHGRRLREEIQRHVAPVCPESAEYELIALINAAGCAGGKDTSFWCLDPVDGTKGFLRGEQYAIALALIQDGEPVLGVLGCPNLPVAPNAPERGVLLAAEKYRGAFQAVLPEAQSLKRVQVQRLASVSEAVFCESVESGHSAHDLHGAIAARLGLTSAPCRMDSQCKYAALARGDASVYLRLPVKAGYQEKLWDHAAGYRVLLEAGGDVTDLHGQPLNFSLGRTLSANQGLVASDGAFHAEILRAVQAVWQAGA
jgi:3'(2'), 5'-bisphosphate nucleotidase